MLDKGSFVKAFQDAREYLFRRERAWAEALENPKAILRLFDLSGQTQEYASLWSPRSMEHAALDGAGDLHRQFWHEVDGILADFFRSLAPNISLVAESPNNIPHEFRLDLGEEPLLTFSITERTFRDARRREVALRKSLGDVQKREAKIMGRIAHFKDMRDNPQAHLKSLGDWRVFLFQRKAATEGITKVLTAAEAELLEIKQAVAACEAALTALAAVQPALETEWQFFQPWFKNLGYTEEEHRQIWYEREQQKLAADEAACGGCDCTAEECDGCGCGDGYCEECAEIEGYDPHRGIDEP